MSWAAEEFATVELGEKRLNKRLVKLAQQLADKPTASIPGACGGWGDTAAAYRMLDNERCDWREIIETHGRCAVQRMAGLPVVLCLDDTTELDFNGQTIEGLGPLSYEAQRGMYLVCIQPPPRGQAEVRDKEARRARVAVSLKAPARAAGSAVASCRSRR